MEDSGSPQRLFLHKVVLHLFAPCFWLLACPLNFFALPPAPEAAPGLGTLPAGTPSVPICIHGNNPIRI